VNVFVFFVRDIGEKSIGDMREQQNSINHQEPGERPKTLPTKVAEVVGAAGMTTHQR
jgi:hypothetical protein